MNQPLKQGAKINLKYSLLTVPVAIAAALFFGLVKVFDGSLPLPQTLNLGIIEIRYYGIIVALAAYAAYILALKRREQYGITQDQADRLILYLIVGGFIGARLYHVIAALPFYLNNPLLIPAVWKGGLGIFGALIGGFIVLWVFYSKVEKVSSVKQSVLNALDWLVPSFAIGQAIGRFGNMFNYEAYGYPTELPWKLFVPRQFRVAPYETYQFYHPVFFYESIASIIIVAVLLYLSPKLRSGRLFFLWLILYNSVRLILEGMRLDSVFIYGFRLNMIVAAILILIGANGLNLMYDNKKPSNS